MSELIEQGHAINGIDPFNMWSALHWAAHKNQEEVITTLILEGCEAGLVSTDTHGEPINRDTAAHVAARAGAMEAAEALIAADIDLKCKNKEGKTAHEVALDAGHAELAEMLKPDDE